jgi:hypothetical protein
MLLRRTTLGFPKLALETFPEDPELWSEALTFPEGHWFAGLSNLTVKLDLVHKASGEGCIACSYDYYWSEANKTDTILEFNQVMDLREYTELRFLHALSAQSGNLAPFNGNCGILICDPYWNWMTKVFGTQPNGQYESKVIDLRKGWYVPYGTPDDFLQTVKYVRIVCDLPIVSGKDYGGQTSFLDRIFFAKEVQLGTLRIVSEPAGKNFEIDGTGGITPATFQITPDKNYVVSIDPADFVQWEDHSVNPSRLIHLKEGATKVITAYYKGTTPPPGAVDWVPLAAGLSAFGLAIVLLQ